MNSLSQDNCVFIVVPLRFIFFDNSSDGFIWQQKVAGVLYFCILECLHTPDPHLLCLACGPAVSGFVCLKQLLARSFLCACDKLINVQ